jgi:hypothetical protein
MNLRATRFLCSLAAIACVTTASLGTTLTSADASQLTTSNSAIDPNTVFTLQSSNQGSALAPRNDAMGNGETGNDVPVVQDQSDGPLPGRTEQMWRFIPQQGPGQIQNTYTPSGPVAMVSGVTNVYEVQNVKSDKCLSVYYNGTTLGTQLVQYDCHAWPDQLWALNRLPANISGIAGYQLQSFSSGLWLGGSTDYQRPAVPLRLDSAANALAVYPKQIFSVTQLQRYRLTTANSLVLDVAAGADDAPAVQSPVRLWQDQSWTFAPQPDGSYEVVNSRSGECLSIYYGSTAAGSGLVQYTCHGWTDQAWDLVPVQDPGIGYSLMLKSRLSGMAVDVPGDTIVQGTQFDQWPATGGINQRFVVTAV